MSNIAKAFIAAQREFGPALKTSVNPHFKSKYANLEAVIEAVRGALLNNGIALQQLTHECTDGVIVETMFLHESGETLSGGKLRVIAAKQDPQGYGSALSYARRYSLLAACGIASEDDDGNSATIPHSPVSKSSNAPAQASTADVFSFPRDASTLKMACDVLELSTKWRTENRDALLQKLKGVKVSEVQSAVAAFASGGDF